MSVCRSANHPLFAAPSRRSGVCVVSLPTLVGASTVPLLEEGVGTERSLVFCRSFAMAGLLRLGGGGGGSAGLRVLPRSWGQGRGRPGARATCVPPQRSVPVCFVARLLVDPGTPRSRATRQVRAELEKRARGPAALRCGYPQKMNKGRLQPTNGPRKSPGTPTQGAQTWEDCSEGHLSYTRGHHCVHSSRSRLNCEEVAAQPHLQYPKWFENVHRLVADFFFLKFVDGWLNNPIGF